MEAPAPLSGLRARASERTAAARLAGAICLGLVFALTLTLFGAPVAHALKTLAPPAAEAAAAADRV